MDFERLPFSGLKDSNLLYDALSLGLILFTLASIHGYYLPLKHAFKYLKRELWD